MVKKVLILCTGNSCRSQMAEALVNQFLAARWIAYSAGTEPAGYVHPMAIRALAEAGIDFVGKSKHIDEIPVKKFDAVITVCDDAAENCPVWLGQGVRVHLGFQDPAVAQGTEEEKFQVFRDVRNGIEEKVLDFLRNLD